MNYNELLAEKRIVFKSSGFVINNNDINQKLFKFQRDIVRYAIRKGKSAIFAETGLGKSAMQTEWSRIVQTETKKPALIIAPLSVAWQTIDDIKELLGIEIKYIKSSAETLAPINITNYERIDAFNPERFGSVALDESSILKSFNSKTRQQLTDMFYKTPYRSCYTATPSPNDMTEIGNHSWFLGIMTEAEMKATFFINRENQNTQDRWSIKSHAVNDFYRWLASWGMVIRKPSDIGYDDNGYILPELNIIPHYIDSGYVPEGMLFSVGLNGLNERNQVRRQTVEDRCNYAASLVNNSSEQFIVWCYLNDEANLMRKLISDSINVEGNDSPEWKAETFRDFRKGKFRVLVTKPKIAGFGMNFQQSWNSVFVGLDDSMETLYQCIRRQWRFMQKHNVDVNIVLDNAQMPILENVKRKERMMKQMQEELVRNAQQYTLDELSQLDNQDNFKYNPGVLFQLPKFMR